jgi:hypothetical protein
MNEKTRKGIIFIVFAATCVWGYLNLFHKPQIAERAQPDLTTAVPVSPTGVIAGPDSTTLAELRNSRWGDDPFKKGDSPVLLSRSVQRPASPKWNLSGIVFSPTDPLAIINGKMVRVGDTVDDATVSKIEKKQVTLDYSGSSVTLTVDKG